MNESRKNLKTEKCYTLEKQRQQNTNNGKEFLKTNKVIFGSVYEYIQTTYSIYQTAKLADKWW